MSNEIAKASDAVCGGLIAGTKYTETAKATGRFLMECFDKDGNLKWSAEESNLVVNVGLQYMAGTALTSTAQITSWFIGLYGAGASNTPSAGDTMSSHGTAGAGGWTEVTPYSGTRPAATFAAATNANPSVVTNTASPASFAITSTQTVGGAFLVSNSTAGGSTGTLFSAADFQSPGDRSVVSGDTLNVTYTFSLAG
jgi:hypothetical protein